MNPIDYLYYDSPAGFGALVVALVGASWLILEGVTRWLPSASIVRLVLRLILGVALLPLTGIIVGYAIAWPVSQWLNRDWGGLIMSEGFIPGLSLILLGLLLGVIGGVMMVVRAVRRFRLEK